MNKRLKTLMYTAIFAAVNYVAFTYGKINIPLAAGQSTAIHVANAVVVLSAWLLGPVWGGLAGAVGLSLADVMDPVYIIYAPRTFFMKFMIGWIAGTIANRRKLSEKTDKKEITRICVLSSAAALLFNVVVEPLIGYLYRRFILQLDADAAAIVAAWSAGVTLLNAVICVILATLLYLALYKPFARLYR
jgi:uncharacterized membrane protein